LIKNFLNNGIEIESIYDKDEKLAKQIALKYNLKFSKIENIRSDKIFIGVNDANIAEVSKMLPSKDFHIHLSGYLPSSILSSEKKLSFHPNTPLNENISLSGVVIDLEGDAKFGKEICSKIGANFIELTEEEKKRLHLSAVINSNFLLALMYMSKKIFPKQWEKISRPLVFNTYENIVNFGFSKALTGPVQRNDIETIEREREIFSKYFDENLYNNFIKILKEIKDGNE
jgi:predicted short-subunit dehydrogenase-like oxidoreductase (DUF2520 family)